MKNTYSFILLTTALWAQDNDQNESATEFKLAQNSLENHDYLVSKDLQ
jgi:hypothetical protein